MNIRKKKKKVSNYKREMDKNKKRNRAKNMPRFDEAGKLRGKNVAVGDVILTMGAGDIYKLPRKILKKLKGQS